jgi:hypothetical protein
MQASECFRTILSTRIPFHSPLSPERHLANRAKIVSFADFADFMIFRKRPPPREITVHAASQRSGAGEGASQHTAFSVLAPKTAPAWPTPS